MLEALRRPRRGDCAHVRRRLFANEDDPPDPYNQARIDNYVNTFQEAVNTENLQKSRRWNFDFKNEVPLEGVYEWYKCDGKDDWIGVQSDKESETNKEPVNPMQLENEVTPRSRDGDAIPVLRKRRRLIETNVNKAARRKICFD